MTEMVSIDFFERGCIQRCGSKLIELAMCVPFELSPSPWFLLSEIMPLVANVTVSKDEKHMPPVDLQNLISICALLWPLKEKEYTWSMGSWTSTFLTYR